ncbi:MAG: hypothetical protein WCA79_09430 [Anaerolineales bacterium]
MTRKSLVIVIEDNIGMADTYRNLINLVLQAGADHVQIKCDCFKIGKLHMKRQVDRNP